MWRKLLGLGYTLSSMLNDNAVPPNTPPKYVKELKAVNFLRSKKFFLVFTSVLMLLIFYIVSVFILFLTAPMPAVTASFVTIFVETIKILAFIIAAYLGLQTAIDFKYNSDSNTSLNTDIEHNEESKVLNTIVELYAEKFKQDPSYAPISWVMTQPDE
jgi:hypothetical protein